MAENFFSILKTECIYRHKPATFSEANEMIDRYIHFYNHERIQSKQECRRSRCATPAKTEYSCTRGSFLCCLHNLGRFTAVPGAFLRAAGPAVFCAGGFPPCGAFLLFVICVFALFFSGLIQNCDLSI